MRLLRFFALLVILFIAVSSLLVSNASTTIPNEIYTVAQGSGTCTLASAVMMMRARTYLSGNNSWNNITESAIDDVAWIEDVGLRWSFTYTFYDNSISVSHIKLSDDDGNPYGIASGTLKSLLNSHPEGIVLYCGHHSPPHAVFVTDYEGNNFYCADPYGGSNSYKRILLSSSRLGQYYNNSQAEILDNVTAYWYISSYSIAPSVYGEEMTTNHYGKVLPNGDYLIAAAGTSKKTSFYYLDIYGTAQPASDSTNVVLTGPLTSEPPSYEIWKVTYGSDGFYTITQKKKNSSDTTMCLDVSGASTVAHANIIVSHSNSNSNQKWAIHGNGAGGYFIQPKHSGGGENGMYLDITGGAVNTSGTNIQQDTRSSIWGQTQTWLFIPYMPSQPIPNGRYIILSGLNPSWEIDVPGDTGNVSDQTAVQLWDDGAVSQYNAFDLEKLSNGYYKITHVASGKALEIYGGTNNYSISPSLMTSNGSNAQQWAIQPMGNGYSMQPRTSGFYMELTSGTLSNGANIRQYVWTGQSNQTWQFVKAEYTIHYEADGSSIILADQTKYYKTNITLDSTVPEKDGYNFLGWSTAPDATIVEYNPGDIYTIDADLTLYPVWESTCTLYFDANGGEYEITQIELDKDEVIVLPTALPIREGYRFLGWSTSAEAQQVDYAPGDTYTANAALTLFAVWEADVSFYGLTIEYYLNGTEAGDTQCGTCDLYIDGEFRMTMTESLTTLQDPGYSYEICNIQALEGYRYVGSSENLSGANQYQDNTIILYFDLMQYEINFDFNGGEAEIEDIEKYHGIDVTLPDVIPEKRAFIFAGWTVDQEGNGTKYQPGSIFGLNENCVLYAQWEPVPVMRLPSGTKTIAEEAFANCGAYIIRVSSGCTTILDGAFSNNPKLLEIHIPASVTSIAFDAFENCPQVIIYAPEGSRAAKLATSLGIPYIAE